MNESIISKPEGIYIMISGLIDKLWEMSHEDAVQTIVSIVNNRPYCEKPISELCIFFEPMVFAFLVLRTYGDERISLYYYLRNKYNYKIGVYKL